MLDVSVDVERRSCLGRSSQGRRNSKHCIMYPRGANSRKRLDDAFFFLCLRLQPQGVCGN